MQSTREIIKEMGGVEAVAQQIIDWQQRIRDSPQHAAYEDICRIEPRVEALRQQVQRIVTSGPFWPQWELIKRQLSRLVGWESGNSLLSSSNDWQICFSKLFTEAERASRE